MFWIRYCTVIVGIWLIQLPQSYLTDTNQLNQEDSQPVTQDPKLLEQYARNTALSFGIFGLVFGLLNLICYIASIYKAVKDRKAIQERNRMKRKLQQSNLSEQKEKLISKATELNYSNSPRQFSPTVIKQSTYPSLHNPDEINPHYFTKSPTLKRASKMLKKSDSDTDPNGTDSAPLQLTQPNHQIH